MKKLLFNTFLLILLLFNTVHAQKQTLYIKHFTKENEILLRWIPSDKNLFELGTRNGYKITRHTKQANILTEAVVIAENLKPYLQTDTAKWNSLIRKKENALLAFKALYENKISGNIPQKTKEEQQLMLHNLMLLSCDLDAEIAQACGLFFSDKTISNNKTYSYTIEINNSSSLKTNPITLDINAGNLSENPPIRSLTGKFKNRNMQLKWQTEKLTEYYGGYDIERSTDSLDYRKINKAPAVLLSSQYEKNKNEINYSDTVPETGIRYFYRIRGINFFGERSTPSNVVTGTGYAELKSSPIIDSIKVINNSKVFLRWTMGDKDENAIPKKFILLRSEKDNGKYSLIFESKELFRFTDEKPKQSNYYKIGVITHHDDTLLSFSSLALIADTIPPSPPSGLKATVDSKGNVQLIWDRNTENDIQGYKIYKSNALNEEFVQMNNEFIRETSYKDKLNLKTLSKKIYYSAVATDNNYNSSALSSPIEVKRPDTIPPSAAIINNLQIFQNGIRIFWIPSSSNDVKQYVLFRQDERTNSEVKIKAWTKADTTTSFMDTLTEMGIGYNYKIVAMDEDDNFSISNIPYMFFETGFRKKIKEINAVVDRAKRTITLNWSYSEKDVEKFIIYRANAKVPLTIIKTLPSPATTFEDNSLSIGNTYEYRIKAVFLNGAESILSDAVTAEY